VSVELLPLPSRVRMGRPGEQRIAAGASLTALTAWRSLVALSAVVGVVLAAIRYDVWWTALSQLASMAVFLAYTGFAAYPHLAGTGRHEPPSAWLRGALATLMVLVGSAYLVVTSGDLTAAYSVFEHLVTPMLVVADFLVVGSNQQALRWWHPLTWLVPPAAYLAWYVVDDLGVYVALDPSAGPAFTMRVGLLCTATLAAGLVLVALGRRTPRPRSVAQSCRPVLSPSPVAQSCRPVLSPGPAGH